MAKNMLFELEMAKNAILRMFLVRSVSDQTHVALMEEWVRWICSFVNNSKTIEDRVLSDSLKFQK